MEAVGAEIEEVVLSEVKLNNNNAPTPIHNAFITGRILNSCKDTGGGPQSTAYLPLYKNFNVHPYYIRNYTTPRSICAQLTFSWLADATAGAGFAQRTTDLAKIQRASPWQKIWGGIDEASII